MLQRATHSLLQYISLSGLVRLYLLASRCKQNYPVRCALTSSGWPGLNLSYATASLDIPFSWIIPKQDTPETTV